MKIAFRKIVKKVLALELCLAMVLTMMAVGGGPAYAAAEPASFLPENGQNGALAVSVYIDGQWREAGRISCTQYIEDEIVSLQGFITPGEGVTVRVTQISGGASHLDAALLGGAAPIAVSGGGDTGVFKLSAKDNDLIGISADGVTLTFAAGAPSPVLTVSARIESENITKEPFLFPDRNLFRLMDEGSHFYTYTLDSSRGSLLLDGEIGEVDGREPFFKEYCVTGTGHPSGYTYGWVMNDDENLYVVLDFTPDNTLDGDKDYAKVYVNTDEGLKEFKISVPETTWGVPGFTYTDRVNYQHKVYEFAISLSEIGVAPGGTLQLAFAAYGTAAPGAYDSELIYDADNERFLAAYWRWWNDEESGEYMSAILACFLDSDGIPIDDPFVVAGGAEFPYAFDLAYDGARFFVAYRSSDGEVRGRLIDGDGTVEDYILISDGEDEGYDLAVAYDGDGAFLVAYETEFYDEGWHDDIYGRLVIAGGGYHTSGDAFLIAGDPGGDYRYYNPSVAYDGDGAFLVAYEVYDNDTEYSDIYGLLLTGDAESGYEAAGEAFLIGSAADYNDEPSVLSGGAGTFLVAYAGYPEEDDTAEVYAQWLNAGALVGESLLLGSEEDEVEVSCRVQPAGANRFFITWTNGSEVKGILAGWDGDSLQALGGSSVLAEGYYYSAPGVAWDGTGFLLGVDKGGGAMPAFSRLELAAGPVISRQPQSVGTRLGGTATFTVEATKWVGYDELIYQWKKDGVNIAGATSDTLTVSNVQGIDAGSYTVMVTDEGGNSVTSAAAALLPVNITTFNLDFSPGGIAVTTGDSIYLTDPENDAVWRMEANGGNIVELGSGFDYPSGIAVDRDGNIYVADNDNDAIKKMDANGGNIVELGSGFDYPSGIAVDRDGNIYVADNGNGAVKKMDANGGNIAELGSGFAYPSGIAVDADGNIYVGESLINSALKKMDANGGNIVELGSGFDYPSDIAVDRDGNIYVAEAADQSYNTVWKMDADGHNIVPLGVAGSEYPGVAVTTSDSIYVTDYSNQSIFKIQPIYAVKYNGNGSTGGSVPTDVTNYIYGDSATVLGNTGSLVRTGYIFAGWSTAPNGSGTVYAAGATVTIPSHNLTLYAIWENIPRSSSGGGTPPVTPATPGGTITAPAPTLNQSTGVAATQISSTDLNTALASAAQDSTGKKTVEITVPPVQGAAGYETSLPASALSSGTDTQVAINTAIANVTLPGNMLSGTGLTGDAGLTIGTGDKSNLPDEVKEAIGDRPLIQLSLSVNGQQRDWNNPSAPVTVSVPYTPTAEELANPESIVVWYIDGKGNAVSVPNGRYDSATGTVIVDVTHFSDYAVVYNQVRFKDVAAGAWHYKAVSFIAAREITTGTGGGNFSPDAKLTRGQFLVMIMKAYGIEPDANGAANFVDAGSTYYTGYLAAAKRLGISGGIGNNLFAPEKEITRQEMFTLLYNGLKMVSQLPQGDTGKTLS
ncbi:MAG TPA: S-layer homology domain-containing protein, partial [Negativicutes bacterium]|nr:S-layer homology domain-containing protein [Negativicutes bacterium]